MREYGSVALGTLSVTKSYFMTEMPLWTIVNGPVFAFEPSRRYATPGVSAEVLMVIVPLSKVTIGRRHGAESGSPMKRPSPGHWTDFQYASRAVAPWK